MKKCPFHELLQKTDQTDVEKVALYGVMRTSTAPDFAHLTPEETWDRMIQEYDNLKMLAHFEGVPEDFPDPIQAEKERKLDDLLLIPLASRHKN
jgi:hypothetical protein